MLRDMMRRLCDATVPLTVLRTLEGGDPGFSTAFWRQLIELGITGVNISQDAGGLGLGALDALVIHEEFGRGLVLAPHFVSSLLAASLLERAGDEQQKRAWLPAIAAGANILTVASLEPGGSHASTGVQCRAERSAAGYRLNGHKFFVPYASSAAAAIVLARTGSEPDAVVALLVDMSSAGLSVQYQANHAREPNFQLKFTDVVVSAQHALNGGAGIWSDWQDVMYAALVPLAAQAVGGAARLLEMTVEYAKQREAFGRPIGGFQSIAHYLADVAVELEGCRTLAQQAAWAKDAGRPYRLLSAMSKLQACEMYRRAAAVAIQVHGGVGYTNDADPQLFFRRAKQLQLLNWDSAYLEDRIAALSLWEIADPAPIAHA